MEFVLTAIESPFGKNPDGSQADDATVSRNVLYLKRCIADSLRRGESPYASHRFFPGVLDDRNPAHRTLGMEAGFAWADLAKRRAVYRDYGITPGMMAGIERAGRLGQEVEVRFIGTNDEVGAMETSEIVVRLSEAERAIADLQGRVGSGSEP